MKQLLTSSFGKFAFGFLLILSISLFMIIVVANYAERIAVSEIERLNAASYGY